MARTYQVSVATRIRDAFIMALLRAGVNMGTTSLLTVHGRRSGQPHSVPVVLMVRDGQRWLVAPYGVVQWVRNIRAAGTATLTCGRRSEMIAVTELSAQQAAPVLKQYLSRVAIVRPYFDVTQDSSLEDFVQEAPHHPVFLVTGAEESGDIRQAQELNGGTDPQATPETPIASLPTGNAGDSATRLVGTVLGVFAGLLGLEHGYFEILQGNVKPSSALIHAIGPPCKPEKVWHGCEPAMTLVPNFLITGILATILSLLTYQQPGELFSSKESGEVGFC